jgi:hypothetical protein
MKKSTDEAAVGSREVTDRSSPKPPLPEQPLITILEESVVADGSRAQAQVAEQYEKIQALSLGRSKDLILDLAPGGADRFWPRRVEKQFVVGPREPAKLPVENREAVTRQPNHRALKARKMRIAARILRERPARRQTIEMYDFFHCIPF